MKLDSDGEGFPAEGAALSPSQCDELADRVYAVLQDIHSNVASPLASFGLQFELLRLNPKTPPDVGEKLSDMIRSLDAMITVLRARSRDLRNMERELRRQQT